MGLVPSRHQPPLRHTHGANFLRMPWLDGIPIPPSLNNAYPTGKHRRRFKSADLMIWESELRNWAFVNVAKIRQVQEQFRDLPRQYVLAIQIVYYFNRVRILTKDGRPKRLDLDNRVKYILDGISRLLCFDDSLIWKITCEKKIAIANESCSVYLSHYSIDSLKL